MDFTPHQKEHEKLQAHHKAVMELLAHPNISASVKESIYMLNACLPGTSNFDHLVNLISLTHFFVSKEAQSPLTSISAVLGGEESPLACQSQPAA